MIMNEAVAVGVGIVGAGPYRRDQYPAGDLRGHASGPGETSCEAAASSQRRGKLYRVWIRLRCRSSKETQKSASIAAASIIAKVTRDRLMQDYDKALPEYGFASNKGYGSAEHIAALKKYGPSPIHRRSFITHFI